MASVTSLGIHTPVALPYLINEGILPQDPKADEYQWEIYTWNDEDDDYDDIEEELLTTRDTVVWSQGKFIRNVYRFNQEGEDVAHALLTKFPAPPATCLEDRSRSRRPHSAHVKDMGLPADSPVSSSDSGATLAARSLAKALVVILKTKIHIFYLQGSSHIIDLPFEVETALPAPLGLVLQRRRTPVPQAPTPQPPRVPPNSFFSSQLQRSSSYLNSPSIAKSFARAQNPVSRSLHGDARLDALFRNIINSAERARDEDVAALYSLTDPLADFGVVTYSLQHQKTRLAGKQRPGMSVDFDGLDSAEEIVYISPKGELTSASTADCERLVLLVTVNREILTVTVWHAWYLREKSLRTLLKLRAESKAAKARRRSSFISASAATGTTTPAVRHRDGARESFAAAGTLRFHGDPGASQPGAVTSRKRQTQEEEAQAMASQMDPDYQPVGSQQLGRETRRISSMNTDVRAGHGTVNANLVGAGGRRHTSFGGPTERRSLGHRRSRGSTPGSVFSRSVGPDDEMDLDSTMDYEDDETIEHIVHHIRATLETSGIDSVFGSSEEGFKRELVVRKIHSFSMGPITWAQGQASRYCKVATLQDSQFPRNKDEGRFNMYFHRQDTKALRCLSLQVSHRPLWPETEAPTDIPIPIVVSDEKMGECEDIARLKDGDSEAILLGGRGLVFALDNRNMCSLPTPPPYLVHDPLDALFFCDQTDGVDKNGTIQPAPGPKALTCIGARGTFDEVAADGLRHRRGLQLRPREAQVDRVLHTFEVVLPLPQARAVRRYWCLARSRLADRPDILNVTACTAESVAAVSTMFLLINELLDPEARATVDFFKTSLEKLPVESSTVAELRKQQHERQLLRNPAWAWMEERYLRCDHKGKEKEDRTADRLLLAAAALASDISKVSMERPEMIGEEVKPMAMRLMLALHIIREDDKLCSLSLPPNDCQILAPMIGQLGILLGLSAWTPTGDTYYALEGATEDDWAYIRSKVANTPQVYFEQEPVGILHWFEQALLGHLADAYPTLAIVAQLNAEDDVSDSYVQYATAKTPRIKLLQDLFVATNSLTAEPAQIVEKMAEFKMSAGFLESFPQSIAAPFKEALARCETNPPATWSQELLRLVGRDDLVMSVNSRTHLSLRNNVAIQNGPRDILSICQSLDQPVPTLKTKEASRNAISQLIFNKDRRLVEVTSLMHFNSVQVAECAKLPEWTEAQHFDQQRRIMFFVAVRMIALPAGDGMLHYDSQTPLLTERYHLPGFSSTVLMQPMGHTLTADRSGLTEEKLNWAYFHAGASAGLRIARTATGIDTSWIAFNKPNELTNRHAGLLLALGLNGHLRHVAKWLSFKYLTPKHTMTSIGLLLGLSASYLGTMDGLITRMLSVHITRMLPPGAAELNVSAVTQTAGLMGIGLLYYNTQHRRMSEVMLSEVEHMEVEDPDSGPDPLRDESYRLAAGFALGLINLGKGDDLRGLHGLGLAQRLLTVAVGPRPVQAVHVFDRATAGAVIAIALIYMKTGDKAVASRIDIPDTEAQFDQVRPDVLMLRAMAKHVIMWDDIKARKGPDMQGWIDDNLPRCYKGRWRRVVEYQVAKRTIDSSQIPLFNVYTGLAWALGLRYAGSGNLDARDDILRLLEFFHTISKGADAYYYDGKLGRAALRRCMDALALSAASVMAGTGDISTFRYLRRMHGRTDADTPYGSHLAAHMAVGTLFLGGGTLTLGTSPLALAGLTAAFYPLFPADVHDNRVHLQAFRHLWVFAVEDRCLIVEDIDTRRPTPMPLRVTLRTGEVRDDLSAPCLLPPLDDIASVQTADPNFWQVTLDFAQNPAAREKFRLDQRVFVRRCPAGDAHPSRFGASLAALEAVGGSAPRSKEGMPWRAMLGLPGLADLDLADVELVLPPDAMSSAYLDERGTRADDRVVLSKAVESGNRDELWNLRALFAWAERQKKTGDGSLRWLGEEVVEKLKARVEARMRDQVEKVQKEEDYEEEL